MSVEKELGYFDWNQIFGRDKLVNIIMAARGRGKTYGLRKQCVRDFLKHGVCFVEICRTLDECEEVSKDYFAKLELNGEFPDRIFKTSKNRAYISKRPTGDEKPKWHLIGYFLSLSAANRYKRMTFKPVRRFIMDEAIIDPTITQRGYLPNEAEKFSSIVDSVTRERPGEAQKIYIYLLGNSADLSCPLLVYYGIAKEPKRGISTHSNVLVMYEDPGEYGKKKIKETAAAKMLRKGSKALEVAAFNRFSSSHKHEIGKKPPSCDLLFGMSYQGQDFGIWIDRKTWLVHVTTRFPKSGHSKPVYSLSLSDGSANYPMLDAASPELKILTKAMKRRNCIYETEFARTELLNILALFGKI